MLAVWEAAIDKSRNASHDKGMNVQPSAMAPPVMFVSIPGQLEPPQTPFERPGPTESPCRFIYLGNRYGGRYSFLLPMDYDFTSLGWGLADYFPQGYTNLYHLEKIHTAVPDELEKAGVKPDLRYDIRVKGPVGFNDQPSGILKEAGRSRFLVLREPIDRRSITDVIGKRFSADQAVVMAKRYARRHERRAVVTRILAVLTWH